MNMDSFIFLSDSDLVRLGIGCVADHMFILDAMQRTFPCVLSTLKNVLNL